MRVDLERIHYKDIDDYTQEIKRISHDYNNNLVILSSLLRENRELEAINFIKDINNQIPNFCNLVKSGNAVIDVVLNHKLNEAKKKEINILLEIDDDIKFNINNVELSSLLSNLLDNAIEATSKVVNRNKRIKIILVNKGGNLIFKVTNSVMSDPREIIKSRKTTKQDKNLHGNGIGIIERIVKKHCGSLIYDYKENLFTVSVLL